METVRAYKINIDGQRVTFIDRKDRSLSEIVHDLKIKFPGKSIKFTTKNIDKARQSVKLKLNSST